MSVFCLSRQAESNTTASIEQDQELDIDNPGSIAKRLEEDSKQKEYLFQFPGLDGVMKPWYEMKAELAEKHGLRFGLSYTTLYQKTNDNFGPKDEAASFDFDLSGTWTFLGRKTTSPTMLGFNFFWRDDLGTSMTPQRLFSQYGALYSGAARYDEEDPVIGELYIQQKFKNTFGFQIGKIFPITAYDFFAFKNFRTDFIDFNHVTNATIPLPGNGLGGFMVYRPQPHMLLRLGAHDANADVQESGFDTYDGELFTILEAGIDTELLPRAPSGVPQGHFHVSLWHQDERDDAGVDDGWGIASTLLQHFGRFTPYVRYGYADVNADGPTPAKHMVNVGLVTDRVFGQSNDRVGLGFSWADPADSDLDDQSAIDAYYRVQVTPEIQLGPTLEVVINPIRNPDEGTVVVYGLRARVAF